MQLNNASRRTAERKTWIAEDAAQATMLCVVSWGVTVVSIQSRPIHCYDFIATFFVLWLRYDNEWLFVSVMGCQGFNKLASLGL